MSGGTSAGSGLAQNCSNISTDQTGLTVLAAAVMLGGVMSMLLGLLARSSSNMAPRPWRVDYLRGNGPAAGGELDSGHGYRHPEPPCRRAAALVAPEAQREPARALQRRGRLLAASELHRNGPLAAQPRDDRVPLRAARDH